MDTTGHSSDTQAFRLRTSDRQAAGQQLPQVVIQKIPTRLYLRKGNSWTPDIGKAKLFDTSWAALEETAHLNIQNFQLVPKHESQA